MPEWLVVLVLKWAAVNPQLFAFFAAVGLLRLLLKPLCSLIQAYVDATETKDDDVWWKNLQLSHAWKSGLYLLDLLASIKPIKKP